MPLAAVIISSKDTYFGGDAATPGIINPWEVFCLQEINKMFLSFYLQNIHLIPLS